jgi:hypothetical protein
MPLPTLNWKYVGALNHAASSINAALDAVFTLGTAVTYADGSARVPGTGSAWTWLREISGVTVAAYGAPPTNALNFRYILGGTVGASAYTFLTPDTSTLANAIVYGMNRNSGAFTSWVNAQPFTSGFSGYWRATRAFSTEAYDSVTMWESQEGCVIQFNRTGTGVLSAVNFGALFDPLTASTLVVESDGRIYSMGGTGSGATLGSIFLANGNGGVFGAGSNSPSAEHAGTFAPGSTVMVGGAGAQNSRFGTFNATGALVSPNGDIVRIPFSQTSLSSGNFLGQGRNFFIIRDAISRQVYTSGPTTVGYVFGASTTAFQDCVLLGA